MKTQSSTTLKLAIVVAMVITMTFSATSALAQTATANPFDNPNQVAILRWYQANTVPTTFSMGVNNSSPIAFDGENIWVASTDGHLAAFSTDGKLVYGPLALPTGTYPVGMTFDGANIWFTDYNNNLIYKFNVTLHTLTHYTVGHAPYFIAFDGANVWVTNNGDNTVAAYKASTGALAKGPYNTRGTSPTGVAFDGKCIWVANTDTNNVAIFDAGSTGGTCPLNGVTTSLPVSQPFGLAWDGFNMWVSYRGVGGAGPGGVVEMVGASGAYAATFGGCATASGTGTVVFDGAYVWEAGGASGICKYKSSLFKAPLGLVGKYSIGGTINQVAFDGANVWASTGPGVAKF
jgi:DNA-binding beta-propeller fold protein YncE